MNQNPNAQKTRRFAIFNILSNHCGLHLTPENVNAIAEEIFKEMESGPTAWAFNGVEAKAEAARSNRAKGGATTGPTKAREVSSTQARKAALARWAKRQKKIDQLLDQA